MKNLVFDFDGTLVDSMKQWAGKMLYVLNKHNIQYPDDIIKTITPLGDKGSAEYFRDVLGLDMPISDIIADMDSYAMKEYAENIIPKESVAKMLEKWQSMGFSLNVLTASPHRMLDVCLKRNGLFDLFDNVWSCDDFNTTKSDVNIYHMVAEKLGTTTDNCIFFDDNIGALQTAKRSGMTVVGVYDESSKEYESEIRRLCDTYIYKMSEYEA